MFVLAFASILAAGAGELDLGFREGGVGVEIGVRAKRTVENFG